MAKDRLPFADPPRIEAYLADAAYIVDHVQWADIDRREFVEESARVEHFRCPAYGMCIQDAELPTSTPLTRSGKATAFMGQLAERAGYDFNFGAIDPAVWNQRSSLSRPDLGAYTPVHRELIPVFAHITIDRPPPTPPASNINDAARRAAGFAARDHPTNPRRAATRPTAGQGPSSTSYRSPAHYRRDPGRDKGTESGRD